jgi:inosine-uridine nucleoside N-ribohydrolase
MGLDLPQSIWIDTDIAMGASRGDVDDGFALAAALMAAEQFPARFRIAGISVVDGNTDAATALKCARAMLVHFPRLAINVVPARDAGEEIANVSSPCTVLALGPLTNVAAALTRIHAREQRGPTIGSTNLSVHWVGGVRHAWSIRRRLSDLNVLRDKAAAQIVRAHTSQTHTQTHTQTQYPLDVVDKLLMRRGHLQRIATMNALGAYLAKTSARWMRRAVWSHGRPAFPVWDLVPVLSILGMLPAQQFAHAAQGRQLHQFDADGAWQAFDELLQHHERTPPRTQARTIV